MALGKAADFLEPRLNALIADAEKNGIAADVAVAVLTDLLDTENFGIKIPAEGGGE
ncbi:hypothetical protein [Acetobacter oeni]|uniref:Uncharacterized protein n=1 Tax=Acetobacter oeni TaxID=304077 RepID=A0A511XJZ3_9PROT|nr:hypothetical protein [Acetobacter oeni]MBB3883468.1 hypothetical protein [Acetobacter oeni]GBR04082.1 hypothetical protein AA21952_1297 [Acetobacter oeni LMG 21952]GEN63249.1 hypothetical protein AOE01nite_14730 [Acetobacter oeni]